MAAATFLDYGNFHDGDALRKNVLYRSRVFVVQNGSVFKASMFPSLRKYKGNSSIALVPKNTEQVSQILKYCNDQQYRLF